MSNVEWGYLVPTVSNRPNVWQATAELRWDFQFGNDPERVLQQRWLCIQGADYGKTEWRDVPDATA